MKKFMKRHDLTWVDVTMAIIILTCVLLLVGANLARREIEERVIREQRIYVTPDGVYAEYKGKIYKHN